MTLKDLTRSAKRIINDALAKYDPNAIVLSYSGGYDSIVSSHIATAFFSGLFSC